MSLVINTNSAATAASNNLNASNAMLQKSLGRLSSGSKITSPADDAGGLAVSMKMSAAIRRTDAVHTNVSNAISFLQTQEGGLKTVDKILNRMSELRTLHDDVTKSASDKANYDVEFRELQTQLDSIGSEKFNSINLFDNTNGLQVYTSEDASQSVTIDQAGLQTAVGDLDSSNTNGVTSLSQIGISTVQAAIQDVADLRATNGAETSRLQFAADMLTINKTNLEAANSRIIDTDVAQESTLFARNNILVQSGAAMLAQANSGSQIALRLLG